MDYESIRKLLGLSRMEKTLVPIRLKTPLEGISLEGQLIEQFSRQMAVARDSQIRAALANAGFIMRTKAELENFARTRCTIVNQERATLPVLRTLYVDWGAPGQQAICQWDDDVMTEIATGNRTTITVKMGSHEYNC